MMMNNCEIVSEALANSEAAGLHLDKKLDSMLEDHGDHQDAARFHHNNNAFQGSIQEDCGYSDHPPAADSGGGGGGGGNSAAANRLFSDQDFGQNSAVGADGESCHLLQTQLTGSQFGATGACNPHGIDTILNRKARVKKSFQDQRKISPNF